MNINKILRGANKRYGWYKEFWQYRDILNKNADLAQIKTGKTCFVIGNGPSVKDQDLTKLADQETFTMNGFWRHPQYKIIKPKYYIATDAPHVLDLSRPRFLLEDDMPSSDPIISQVPETKLIFSAIAKKSIENNGLFKHNKKYYVLQQGLMDERLHFNLNITKPMPYPKSSHLLAMILALYMGFEKIYLLGCEHDFLKQPMSTTHITLKHFYEEPPGDLADHYKTATYEASLSSCLRLFRNYRFFKEKIAKSHPGVRIFNATPNSFLDVFPMVDFDEVLNKELV